MAYLNSLNIHTQQYLILSKIPFGWLDFAKTCKTSHFRMLSWRLPHGEEISRVIMILEGNMWGPIYVSEWIHKGFLHLDSMYFMGWHWICRWNGTFIELLYIKIYGLADTNEQVGAVNMGFRRKLLCSFVFHAQLEMDKLEVLKVRLVNAHGPEALIVIYQSFCVSLVNIWM